MNKDELLKPRYKVIADYPGNDFRVGTILNDNGWGKWLKYGDKMINKSTADTFPHLFRKLEWWEEREEKDMPKYVTWNSCNSNKKYVVEVLEIKDDTFRWQKGWERFTSGQDFPATKEEYEEQNMAEKTHTKTHTNLTEKS